MDNRKCAYCGNPIPPKPKHMRGDQRKYCSNECSRLYHKQRYNESNPYKGTTPATTGAISELRVATDLLVKGYNVFRALSPSCPCDLVIFKDHKVLKIEVRTSYINTSGNFLRVFARRDNPESIDIYAWVLPDKIIYEPELERLPNET